MAKTSWKKCGNIAKNIGKIKRGLNAPIIQDEAGISKHPAILGRN